MATREAPAKKRPSRPAFASKLPRAKKREAGRTDVTSTPLVIHSASPVSEPFAARIRERLARAVGRHAALIERGTVRFEDVNGPRGGVDTVCRVRLVLSGMPAFVVSARGVDLERAFAAVVPKVEAATGSRVDRRRGH